MVIPKTEVLVRKGTEEIARHTVQPGDYVIGRDMNAEIRIEGVEQVSRQHAKLVVNYSEIFVEDLGSANGTFINGQPVTEVTKLWPGQKIQIGDAVVEIHRVKEATSPDVSLAPHSAQVRKLLPEEVRGEKKYQIGTVVAQGGMGAILDVNEVPIRRKVAMKVMLHDGDAEGIARFVEEGQITGQLEHPNIVPVHELGVNEQDQPFYTMKFVRGISLRKALDLISEGHAETVKKYPLPALLTILQKVCDGIAFAHSKKVIHRDLKPDNIMLGEYGEALVMDWGLAKVLGRTTLPKSAPEEGLRSVVRSARNEAETGSVTMAGTIMGTPNFMSPEQANGEIEKLDARTDIYALGAILYQILTLQLAVEAKDIEVLLEKVRSGAIISPLKKVGAKKLPHLPLGRIPESLSAVAMKALALHPEARYGTVKDFQKELAAYQNGFATGAEKAGAWRQITLLIKRNKAAALGVAAVFLVGSVLGTKAIIEGRRATQQMLRAEQALENLKKTAPALRQLAASEADGQRFDSALQKIDAALALDSGDRESYWQRAWILLGQEKFPEAIAAFHAAARLDPAHPQYARIIPHLETVAALPDEKSRSLGGNIGPIFDYLTEVGASGEARVFVHHMQLGSPARLEMVRRGLEHAFGDYHPKMQLTPTGFVQVELTGQRIRSLEPLRGLPIDVLTVSNNPVESLEPLRGMRLRRLDLITTGISDLTPLRGAALIELMLSDNGISDLTPLAGMPLTLVKITNCPIADLTPLRGTPIEELLLNGLKAADLSFLHGMPLRKLSLLNLPVHDLSPLAGLPLAELEIRSCGNLTDLSPLLQVPALRRLTISAPAAQLLPLRVHSGLTALQIGNAEALPPGKIWPQLDAQQNLAASYQKDLVQIRAALPALGPPVDFTTSIMSQWGVFLEVRNPTPNFGRDLLALPIGMLVLNSPKFTDLAPLRGLRAKAISFARTGVKDVSPLLDMPNLEVALVAEGVTNLEVLRHHPTLKYLGFQNDWDAANYRSTLTTAAFWARFDAPKGTKQ